MTRIMYEVPSDPSIAKVTITADCVNGTGEPVIQREENRPARPRLGAASLQAQQGGKSGPRGNAS